MSEKERPSRVSATRRLAATPEAVFAVVSSPAGHVRIDGSGMLEAATDPRPLSKVGDVFHLDMDREPLGDLPGVGKYKVMNTVTRIVPGRLFEWSVGNEERPSYGHVYGWEIEPVGEGECIVTNYCDWSGISESRRVRTAGRWPVVPVAMMEKSVDNLARLVTGGACDR